MALIFPFNKYVTGRYFIGRKNDVEILSNLLNAGEHVVIYDAPKTGKMSLVQQALYEMKLSSVAYSVCRFSFMNCRSAADLVLKFGSGIIRTFCTTPSEYADAVACYLPDTHFVFDEEAFISRDMILSLKWDVDDNDIMSVFSLPFRIASDRSERLFIILEEFQDILLSGEGEHLCRLMEQSVRESPHRDCSLILTGSKINAMKYIFSQKHFFHNLVERVELSEIGTKDIVDFVVHGFLTGGKVIDRDLMLGVCKLFRGNMWYINHFCSIADTLSKGYIMEPVLVEALDIMLSIYEPRFINVMEDLTTFQICLLRAIVDGHTKFSSSEVISRYNLNSSANVRRLKDALCRKEIVTFDGHDEPSVIDPLFEYWVRKTFFEIG